MTDLANNKGARHTSSLAYVKMPHKEYWFQLRQLSVDLRPDVSHDPRSLLHLGVTVDHNQFRPSNLNEKENHISLRQKS